MSTTTKTLDVTFLMTEASDPTDTKTRKISVPANPSTTTTDIKTRIKSINTYLPTADSETSTGGVIDFVKGISATFQEVEKDGADTYTYIPKSITKAELVTTTEDIIYGN